MIHPELGREIASLSYELSRQVGLLIDRGGVVRHVIIGDTHHIEIPELGRARAGTNRLRGLRCVHTHLGTPHLSQEDLTDMALLRLDMMASVKVDEKGSAQHIQVAHPLPSSIRRNEEAGDFLNGTKEPPWEILEFRELSQMDLDISTLILSLEGEFARVQRASSRLDGREKTLLVLVDMGDRKKRPLEAELDELAALAQEAGLTPVGRVVQRRRAVEPRYVIGRGRLADILIRSLQLGVEALVFAHELTPSQVRSLGDFTDLKILDRTQIILDIFAQRAVSRVGKLQVELAQLRYMLPRLSTKSTAMSRLTGGIGGRGPGETKLEIHRRRAHERIRRLENDLKNIQQKRIQGRLRRQRRKVPVLSFVGYTNAGKSTLLNTLTHSQILAEDRLFATLDTSSRRLRLPREQEVIITDTVGFIHDLPNELVSAFRSTLEELGEADLLLHVVDTSDPGCEENLTAVESLLAKLGLDNIPLLRVFNKMDKADEIQIMNLCRRYEGVAACGVDPATLIPLLEEAADRLGKAKSGVKDVIFEERAAS